MKRGIRFPLILGHEGAGVVEAIGESVRSLKPGDRVACTQWTEVSVEQAELAIRTLAGKVEGAAGRTRLENPQSRPSYQGAAPIRSARIATVSVSDSIHMGSFYACAGNHVVHYA